MIDNKELKRNIEKSIKNFNKEDLFDSSLVLFEKLGYYNEGIETDRDYVSDSQSFIDIFIEDNDNIPDGKIDLYKEKMKLKDWKEVRFLFQLSDENLFSNTIRLFDNDEILNNTNIYSYLFFVIELNSDEINRTELSQITRYVNKLFLMPAMILFKYGNNLTLALIDRRLHKRDKSKDVLEKVTLIKDININQPHRAHIEILYDLSKENIIEKYNIRSFEDLHNAWKKILNTKELNKRFFRELSDWYFWALQNVEFPKPPKGEDENYQEKAVIRLITRIIFAWFMKEKGLIPEELFDKEKLQNIIKFDADESSYYKAILQNLFFATLNKEMGKREFRKHKQHYGITNLYRYERFFKNKERFLKLIENIPFLNGGLFECLDRDDIEHPGPKGGYSMIRIDGFSDRPDNVLKVSNELFFAEEFKEDLSDFYGDTRHSNEKIRGLINLLNNYKFTITENTPIEEEIALDPELLGRVFENLLASYNPETQTTARKESGSFYTPREIVDYMVTESLKAYLKDKLIEKYENAEELDNKLDELFSYSEKQPFSEAEAEHIIDAIDNLKILDPACGSGAFPMGILHKVVYILSKVDSNNEKWKNKQIRKIEDEIDKIGKIIDDSSLREKTIKELKDKIKEIKESFEDNYWDYGRKLYLIENGIYGVDIQPIAIQISKLRFFISLLVDQKINDEKENRGIRPLPNLETKFVSADTLKKIPNATRSMAYQLVNDLEQDLLSVRKKHFEAKTPKTKKKLRKKDKEIREQMRERLKGTDIQREIMNAIVLWDPYNQNISANFFDPTFMFGVDTGFDIIIGNPPYIQLQKNAGKLANEYKGYNYYTLVRTGDIYTLFYERGNELLNRDGHLIFITSNKWMRAGYGKKLRNYLSKETTPKLLIDLGPDVFESATVDTNILMFQKGISQHINCIACILKDDFKKEIEGDGSTEVLREYIKNNKSIMTSEDFSDDSWIILTPIEKSIKDKIEKIGKPLKDWDIKIYRGILTGFNEAFIIDGETKDELIAKDPKSAEIIKPILRGRDIKRYKAEFADKWLINMHNGYYGSNGEYVSPIDINDYPAIKEHLDGYWDRIERRQDQGDTPYNLRNCAYIEEFEKEKIVWAETAQELKFYLGKQHFYTDKTAFILIGQYLQYLLAILNSNLIDWVLRNTIANLLGQKGLQLAKIYIERLPIPQISKSQQKPFEELVNIILAKKEKREDTTEEEKQIDLMVYKLYNLTYEEVKVIDPNFPLTEEEYNSFEWEER